MDSDGTCENDALLCAGFSMTVQLQVRSAMVSHYTLLQLLTSDPARKFQVRCLIGGHLS